MSTPPETCPFCEAPFAFENNGGRYFQCRTWVSVARSSNYDRHRDCYERRQCALEAELKDWKSLCRDYHDAAGWYCVCGNKGKCLACQREERWNKLMAGADSKAETAVAGGGHSLKS